VVPGTKCLGKRSGNRTNEISPTKGDAALDELFNFPRFSKTVAELLCANFLQTATKLNL